MRVTAAHSPGVEVSILRVELAVEVWTEAGLRGHHTVCTHTQHTHTQSILSKQTYETATQQSHFHPAALLIYLPDNLSLRQAFDDTNSADNRAKKTASQFSWKIWSKRKGFNFPCLSVCGTGCQSSLVCRQENIECLLWSQPRSSEDCFGVYVWFLTSAVEEIRLL